MENVRNFGVQNRSSIITTIYVVAVLVLVWYLIKFYLDGTSMDKTLLNAKMDANVNRQYTIAESDEKAIRMKTGSEYTVSMWLYVKNWDTKQTSVFSILDGTAEKLSGGFYPNEPKMYIRRDPPGTIDTNPSSLPECDVVDISVQRWVHVTVSVNARIMDVYVDGKLARSCLLDNVQQFSGIGKQNIIMRTFAGFYSGIHYQAYAATPDEIHARYASGPYAATGFLDFLMEKVGIKVQYTE